MDICIIDSNKIIKLTIVFIEIKTFIHPSLRRESQNPPEAV